MKNILPPDSLRYLGAGLQLAVTILLGLGLGYFLDRHFNALPWFTLTGSFLGFVLAFVQLLAQFREHNDVDSSK